MVWPSGKSTITNEIELHNVMFENYFFTNRIIYIPRKDEHQKYLVTFLNPKIKKVDNDC